MKDMYGRQINYLRLSVTDRCNLRCRYCMPPQGIIKESMDDILSFEEIRYIVKLFTTIGINKLRLTGGEPLVRRKLPHLVEAVKRENHISDFSITTNGILLKKYAKDLKNAGITRINISLDTLKPEKYRYITKWGNLKDVLDGIETVRQLDLHPIKINTVMMKGVNDDEINDLIELTRYEDIEIRFIELMPQGNNWEYYQAHYTPNEVVMNKFPNMMRLPSRDRSATAVRWKVPGYVGTVGLINPNSHKFCGACNRVRVTADGKMKTCLHSNNEVDLKDRLRKNQPIEDIIRQHIFLKPLNHHLETGEYVAREMSAIGG